MLVLSGSWTSNYCVGALILRGMAVACSGPPLVSVLLPLHLRFHVSGVSRSERVSGCWGPRCTPVYNWDGKWTGSPTCLWVGRGQGLLTRRLRCAVSRQHGAFRGGPSAWPRCVGRVGGISACSVPEDMESGTKPWDNCTEKACLSSERGVWCVSQ